MDEQRSPLKSELKFLERLSIEELEALLKLSGDPNDVELLFDTVVEEVVAREREKPTGRLPDVDAAWDELQARYQNMPDTGSHPQFQEQSTDSTAAEPLIPVPDKPRRASLSKAVRLAAVMAAAVALCLALMVGAQAAGADIFGALARWTDDTFHFETWSAEPTYCEALYNAIQETFSNQGVIGEYVPTWYPNGFHISNTMVTEDDLGISIRILLSNEEESFIGISVDQYKNNAFIDPQTFEIEGDSVEKYPSKGKVYYIAFNEESITASWSNGIVVYTVWGEIDINSIKLMIDSIGG
ncbi:MAG: DUF4367 domain-containing protein [Oscillospiraceae bacterium]|nr:DUF4367 domain-containing protein [Oscillospiraceae bacterium]